MSDNLTEWMLTGLAVGGALLYLAKTLRPGRATRGCRQESCHCPKPRLK